MPFQKGNQINKGRIPWNKGKKRNVTWGANLSKALKGKKKSIEHRKKLSLAKMGSKNNFWKGGITTEYVTRLSNINWKLIRERCLYRDDYRCQICGTFKKKLEIHHIIPWRISRDDSFSNLISVCRQCHLKLERRWKYE